MGVGHVPAREIRPQGQGDDVSRRQHRGARTDLPALSPSGRARSIAALGETLAARFLVDRGAVILGRNARVGRQEIDLHVSFGSTVVAVEVKTVTAGRLDDDPAYRFTAAKARRIWSAAHRLRPPAVRVDLVAVTLGATGVDVRWIRGAEPAFG